MIYTVTMEADCIQWTGDNGDEILAWAKSHGFDGYWDTGDDDVLPGVKGFEELRPYVKLGGCGSVFLDRIGDWAMVVDGELAQMTAQGFEAQGWRVKP